MATQGKAIQRPPKTEAQGDAVIEALYRRHFASLQRYIARTFGLGPPDPEDAVHAAFERFAALEDRSKIENPHAFLLRSARNVVLDQRRRQTVRSRYRQSLETISDESDDIDAERVLSAKERWETLERTIRQMDERHREMLIMNRIHGLSYAEIARRKSCSATLVKTVVGQALQICEGALRERRGA